MLTIRAENPHQFRSGHAASVGGPFHVEANFAEATPIAGPLRRRSDLERAPILQVIAVEAVQRLAVFVGKQVCIIDPRPPIERAIAGDGYGVGKTLDEIRAVDGNRRGGNKHVVQADGLIGGRGELGEDSDFRDVCHDAVKGRLIHAERGRIETYVVVGPSPQRGSDGPGHGVRIRADDDNHSRVVGVRVVAAGNRQIKF